MGEKDGKGEEKPKKPEEGSGGPTTVVLKVDLHCEGCALKVKRSVKRFEGVETVSVDIAANKLTVVGKADPVMLRDRVEEKTRKKAVILSTAISAAKPKDSGGDTKNPAPGGDSKKPAASGGAAKEAKKSTEEKKAKTPQVSTVVLKIRLHCEGCINRIRKSIYKIKGVEDVSVDASKDLVTVKGTMDPKLLPSILKDKLRRGVDIVPSKKDDSGGGKKGEDTGKKGGGDGESKKGADGGEKKKDSGGGEKKKDGGGDGGGDKKKEIASGDNNMKKEVDKATPTVTMNKMEYVVDMVHAPQMFSDENPNACTIM